MYSIEAELKILEDGLTELGLCYDEDILNKFKIYLKLLFDYKDRLHLISHRDYTRISLKHFLPSLMVLKYISDDDYACDIGTGAGFPSIPLKIIKPVLNLTLFESVGKKVRFLKELIEKLGFTGIRVINERAEDYGEKNRFTLILIRAAGRINDLIDTIDMLMTPKGKAIFFKTPKVDEEIKKAIDRIQKKGFYLQIEKTFTPLEKVPLNFVILRKYAFCDHSSL